MRLRPFLRGKSWKEKLTLPEPTNFIPEETFIPKTLAIATKFLMAPGVFTLLNVLMKEYLEEPFYRLNKLQSIWLSMTGAVFQGTLGGVCLLKGVTSGSLYLLGPPLSLLGFYSMECESWSLFASYTLTQIIFAFQATRLASFQLIPLSLMPSFLGFLMFNCTLCLHVLFRLSSKERYCLRLEKIKSDMQENIYKPSNSLQS
jgi:hypothetical protein